MIRATSLGQTNGAIRILNAYDHHHRRIRKTIQSLSVQDGASPQGEPPMPQSGDWTTAETHTYIWDGNNIALETIACADGSTRTCEYFWGPDLSGTEQGAGGVEGLLAVSMDGVFYIPSYDHNGDIVLYVSETGSIAAQYTYAPYGNMIDSSGSLADVFAFGFSTKYHDRETGMVSYQRRFYRPGLGRWLNRDPIEEEGGENLYAFCKNNPVLNVDINGENLRVDKNGTQITVVLNITIYYANDIEKRANTDLEWIARRIKNTIERYWNSQIWHYQCCTISFRVNVSTHSQVDTCGLDNDNLIAITTDANHRSYVINMNRGIWGADNRPGSDWRFAHEAGHLMGLDDDYTDEDGPNPGHAGHMMAVYGGIVDVHEVMDIIRRNDIHCGEETVR